MDLDSALTDKPAEGATATEILRADHREVSRLFREFEGTGGDADDARRVIVQTLCMQLDLHDRIETDVFYPAVRAAGAGLVDTALHEHAEIRRVTEEVMRRADEGGAYAELVTRLEDLVEHHIREEEERLFPSIEAGGRAIAGPALGSALIRRKEELTGSTRSLEGPAT